MSKVRVLGPRARLPEVLRALQDFGLLQLASAPSGPSIEPAPLSPRDRRCREQLQRIHRDIDAALAALPAVSSPVSETPERTIPGLVGIARQAARIRRKAERLALRERTLTDERTSTRKYRDLFDAFRDALEHVARTSLVTHAFVVPARERPALASLSQAIAAQPGPHYAIATHDLPDGDVALLLMLPAAESPHFESIIGAAGLPELGVPAAYAGRPLAQAIPLMLARLEIVERELAVTHEPRVALARDATPRLVATRPPVGERLARLDALAHVGTTPHAFAIDGWVPTKAVADLTRQLSAVFDLGVVVQVLARDQWMSDSAPVALTNPRLFRPFEAIVRLMPLPRYGTIDPTPFVAVFFPMLFGMILGDVGYGVMLAALAALLRFRSRAGAWQRTVADIAAPCAVFAIIFGAIYGECFGSAGQRWLPWRPLLDRERATLATLAAAVGLGLAHVVLGLVLGAISSWRGQGHARRQAIGRGVTAIMLLLTTTALLAAFKILPHALFTPAIIALLIAFPILVFAEGALGLLELLSTVGNVLSYARIMALGTASVMMAAVANRLGGAMGSALVGVALALLFHLVNFALGLFSPVLQALRLQYVEFFHQFYSPGGQPYRPFARATGDDR